MRIAWSPLAVERACEAARFIARDNRAAAERWVEGLFEAVERLGKFPNLGRTVPELERPEIRQITYGSYRVIYRVAGSEISVLTIRHGRRLLDRTELVTP